MTINQARAAHRAQSPVGASVTINMCSCGCSAVTACGEQEDNCVTAALQHCSIWTRDSIPCITCRWMGQVRQLPGLCVNIKILRHYAIVSVVGPTVLCSSSTPLPGMMQCPSKYKVLLWAGPGLVIVSMLPPHLTQLQYTMEKWALGCMSNGQNKEQLSRMIGSVANQSAMGRI